MLLSSRLCLQIVPFVQPIPNQLYLAYSDTQQAGTRACLGIFAWKMTLALNCNHNSCRLTLR